jgi:O-succinylbenzoic acid--CoA ligase
MLQMLTSPVSNNSGNQSEDRYPFTDLWINGRHVSFEKILHDKEEGRSPFEQTTFQFIKEWLSGEEQFELTTSGSTGKAKQITLTRNQLIFSAQRTAQAINLQRYSRALVCIDTKYVGGRMMLVRCFTSGLRIMALDPTANPLVKIPVDKWVQFTAFVPYQVSAILESKHPHLLNNLEKVLIGGAPLPAKTGSQLDRFQCDCYETYGMTETVSHVALRLVNTDLKQPYFETLPGITVSQDERGCLVVTADFLPNAVVTNDLVEILAPGKFSWIGRWDSVINTGGVKVVPEKIERELGLIFKRNNVPHRFFIAASPDEKLGSKVVLVLEGVQFSSESLSRSLDELKSAVSAYELPKEVLTMHEFALTESGKVDRNQTLAGVAFLSTVK